jgi:DUF438 domain-containing protein
MSELINNNQKRKELLKHLILQLHEGKAAEAVKKQLIRLLGKVPYGLVVETEQELISEGLPAREVLKLCDVHGEALRGVIDLAESKDVPPGHPVDTFRKENKALKGVIEKITGLFKQVNDLKDDEDYSDRWIQIHQQFNYLMDVDKHYRRKENLLFPFLEKYQITGPPTVMWGKDDEIRGLLKAAREALSSTRKVTAGEASAVIDLILTPAVAGVDDMIYKEEEILFPMCMDTLTELEWYDIYQQSAEVGFCLIDPRDTWEPSGGKVKRKQAKKDGKIQLPSGNFTLGELTAVFNTLPVDITFVDKDDTVRFFSENKERIFDRNRAIVGRKVQMCHPPASVHMVQQILDDFRAGKENNAAFWINLHGKFIHIEYFALRDKNGNYIGTLEVSQDLTNLRKLEGEQRLLNYSSDKHRK